jgi:hypothetical protein
MTWSDMSCNNHHAAALSSSWRCIGMEHVNAMYTASSPCEQQ